MTHHFAPSCAICGTPVPLEICKVDECGLGVHQECYVDRVLSRLHADPFTKPPAQLNFKSRRNSGLAVTSIKIRIKHAAQPMPRWSVIVTAIAAVLVIGCAIAYRTHRPTSHLEASGLKKSNALSHPSALTKPPLLNRVSRSPSAATELEKSLAAFHRVRVGQHEVDYLADDVTVRHFTEESAAPLPRSASQRVNFGDDVTVSYFAPKRLAPQTRPVAALTPPPSSDSGKPDSQKLTPPR